MQLLVVLSHFVHACIRKDVLAVLASGSPITRANLLLHYYKIAHRSNVLNARRLLTCESRIVASLSVWIVISEVFESTIQTRVCYVVKAHSGHCCWKLLLRTLPTTIAVVAHAAQCICWSVFTVWWSQQFACAKLMLKLHAYCLVLLNLEADMLHLMLPCTSHAAPHAVMYHAAPLHAAMYTCWSSCCDVPCCTSCCMLHLML